MKKILRVMINVIHPFRRLYWFVFRPKTYGVKCVVEQAGRILLIKPSYGHKTWTLPSGGVKHGESFEQACRREVKEETGLDIEDVEKVGEFENRKEYKKDTVVCFTAVGVGEVCIDNVEVVEYGWFLPDDIPNPHMPSVDRVLNML